MAISVRDHASKLVVEETIEFLKTIDPPSPRVPLRAHVSNVSDRPICIIGAGCTGLYAAMILDSLNSRSSSDSPKISYEILEAGDRIGGRIYTHRFNPDAEARHDAPINEPARYDYVDIGAMRYPNIEFMKRVFDLFEKLDMRKGKELIEYRYSHPHSFKFFNGVRLRSHEVSSQEGEDVFKVSEAQGGAVPNDYAKQGAENLLSEIFRPFAEKFEEDFEDGWRYLTQFDSYSTCGYLLREKSYPEVVVQWLETLGSATGLYNDAFMESTMDTMDFGSTNASRGIGEGGADKEPAFDWYCIDGGSEHIIRRMVDKITHKPLTGRRVTKIQSTSGDEMRVTFTGKDGKEHSKVYSQVICTVPLGCLAAIDIPRDDLSYLQRTAIRSLNYDSSTKIALKFEKRWWEDPEIMQGKPIKGGTSSSDTPIRTCVYPSYGLSVSHDKAPGVLLASYTWAQDAQRLGGLAQGKGTPPEDLLIDLTLQNLSEIHGVPREKFGKLVDHYAYTWHNDPNARGAFALFGPGQFGSPMFTTLKMPAAGKKLHIAGEATSVHHAWVLGALNSAWRAVYNALDLIGSPEAIERKRSCLIQEWGIPDEEDPELLVKLAALVGGDESMKARSHPLPDVDAINTSSGSGWYLSGLFRRVTRL